MVVSRRQSTSRRQPFAQVSSMQEAARRPLTDAHCIFNGDGFIVKTNTLRQVLILCNAVDISDASAAQAGRLAGPDSQ